VRQEKGVAASEFDKPIVQAMVDWERAGRPAALKERTQQ
jgi:hypothetical protein